MKQKRTFLFVLEVVPMSEGQVYLSLPLHCTLARFATDKPAKAILDKTSLVFARSPAILLRAGKPRRFGSVKRPHRTEVNLVDKTHELNALHMKLYRVLNELDVQYSNASYVGEGYKPHVSKRGGKRLEEGAEYLSHFVYFIEIHPSSRSSSQKYIYARLPLLGAKGV